MADLSEYKGIDDSVWAIVDAPVTWEDVESEILGAGHADCGDGLIGDDSCECTEEDCCDNGIQGLPHDKLIVPLVVSVVGKDTHPDESERGVELFQLVEYLDEYPVEFFNAFTECFYDVEVSIAELKTHCDGDDYLHVTGHAKDPEGKKASIAGPEIEFGPIDTSKLNKQNAANYGLDMWISGPPRG